MFSYPQGIITPNTNKGQLYGLSSFWSTMMSESALVDGVLSVGAFELGLIYSALIQNCSAISLNSTQTYLNKEISLQFFSEGDLTVPPGLVDAQYIVDRPYLPTLILEKDVHFTIENGQFVTFLVDPFTLPFSTRTTASGEELALWFVNTKFDEQYLYNNYGRMLDIPPQPSSDTYKAFLQANLFMFTFGPNISVLQSGINIAIGLPLAQYNDETVINTYTASNEYVVITNMTAYSVPSSTGLTVPVGTTFQQGDPIFSSAIGIFDYLIKDKWWIGYAIPSQLSNNAPPTIAQEGNWVDQVMENYLKYHTFLITFSSGNVSNVQNILELSNLAVNAIPSYTYAFVFLSVPTTEVFNPIDTFSYQYAMPGCEKYSRRVEMNRSKGVLYRGCPRFQRDDIPSDIYNRDLGQGSLISSFSDSSTGTSGVLFPLGEVSLSPREIGWKNAIFLRNVQSPRTRGELSWTRGYQDPSLTSTTVDVSPMPGYSSYIVITQADSAPQSSPQEVTDYTISSTGLVTFTTAPTGGVNLYWSGSAQYGTQLPLSGSSVLFGTGDGTTTQFQLTYTFVANSSESNPVDYHGWNPFAPLIPLYLTTAEYLEQYITLTGWETIVEASSVPTPTAPTYLQWYIPESAYAIRSPSGVLTGATLHIYNILDNIYSVNLVVSDDTTLNENAFFGKPIAEGSLSYDALAPFYRGGAAAFGNPMYFSRDRNSDTYSDFNNTSVSATRNGFNLSGSAS